MSVVSFVKIRNDSLKSLKGSILAALKLIEYDFPQEIKNVIIKPNMCYYWDYSTGLTTDPRFIASLINAIRERTSSNPHISIVESDASAMKCKYVFKMLGYERLSQDYNVDLVNLSEDACDQVNIATRDRTLRLMLPQTIRNADLRINVPKIKYTTENIKLTCALKNVFGCNPYPKKFKYHPHLDEAIVAINKIMKFDLCIIDGNIVSGAHPRRLGLVMASSDPVALDAAAAEIAGLNPRAIRYLKLAEKEQLGRISFEQRGEPLSYFRDRYPRTTIRQKVIAQAYTILSRSGIGTKLGLI